MRNMQVLLRKNQVTVECGEGKSIRSFAIKRSKTVKNPPYMAKMKRVPDKKQKKCEHHDLRAKTKNDQTAQTIASKSTNSEQKQRNK